MAEIQLVNGKGVALLDDEDFARLSAFAWYLHPGGFATRPMLARSGRSRGSRYMHRDVLHVPVGLEVDHANHDRLDNRKQNLRICSHSQNLGNQRPRRGTSIYKGVHLAADERWHASIHFNEKTHSLGRFLSESEPRGAYDVAAVVYFGRFAKLNFPLPDACSAGPAPLCR